MYKPMTTDHYCADYADLNCDIRGMRGINACLNKRPKVQKQSKYKNQKTEIDGITFDSRKEAARYSELKNLERAGEIRDLELQPKFTLLKSFKHEGKTIRGVTYRADFKYYDIRNDRAVIEDVKGMKTDVYKLKKKFMQSMGYNIVEI